MRAGTLVRVRRGAYVITTPDEPQLPPSALIEAAGPFIGDGVVLSHLSAAALWGMPLWRLAHDRRVWLTRSGPDERQHPWPGAHAELLLDSR